MLVILVYNKSEKIFYYKYIMFIFLFKIIILYCIIVTSFGCDYMQIDYHK